MVTKSYVEQNLCSLSVTDVQNVRFEMSYFNRKKSKRSSALNQDQVPSKGNWIKIKYPHNFFKEKEQQVQEWSANNPDLNLIKYLWAVLKQQ